MPSAEERIRERLRQRGVGVNLRQRQYRVCPVAAELQTRTGRPGHRTFPCALEYNVVPCVIPARMRFPRAAAINRITNEKEAIKYLISRIISMNPFHDEPVQGEPVGERFVQPVAMVEGR